MAVCTLVGQLRLHISTLVGERRVQPELLGLHADALVGELALEVLADIVLSGLLGVEEAPVIEIRRRVSPLLIVIAVHLGPHDGLTVTAKGTGLVELRGELLVLQCLLAVQLAHCPVHDLLSVGILVGRDVGIGELPSLHLRRSKVGLDRSRLNHERLIAAGQSGGVCGRVIVSVGSGLREGLAHAALLRSSTRSARAGRAASIRLRSHRYLLPPKTSRQHRGRHSLLPLRHHHDRQNQPNRPARQDP